MQVETKRKCSNCTDIGQNRLKTEMDKDTKKVIIQ